MALAPMTDDELRSYLKPKHNWLGVIGAVIGVLGAAAGIGKWVFTAPTAENYEKVSSKVEAVVIDHVILKANVDGLRNDVADVRNVQRAELDKINVKLDKVLDRRR